MHLEQMHGYRTAISEALDQSKSQLDRLSNDIGKNLEKISSREKYLNSQLESLLTQFRSAQDRIAETREKYRLSVISKIFTVANFSSRFWEALCVWSQVFFSNNLP